MAAAAAMLAQFVSSISSCVESGFVLIFKPGSHFSKASQSPTVPKRAIRLRSLRKRKVAEQREPLNTRSRTRTILSRPTRSPQNGRRQDSLIFQWRLVCPLEHTGSFSEQVRIADRLELPDWPHLRIVTYDTRPTTCYRNPILRLE